MTRSFTSSFSDSAYSEVKEIPFSKQSCMSNVVLHRAESEEDSDMGFGCFDTSPIETHLDAATGSSQLQSTVFCFAPPLPPRIVSPMSSGTQGYCFGSASAPPPVSSWPSKHYYAPKPPPLLSSLASKHCDTPPPPPPVPSCVSKLCDTSQPPPPVPMHNYSSFDNLSPTIAGDFGATPLSMRSTRYAASRQDQPPVLQETFGQSTYSEDSSSSSSDADLDNAFDKTKSRFGGLPLRANFFMRNAFDLEVSHRTSSEDELCSSSDANLGNAVDETESSFGPSFGGLPICKTVLKKLLKELQLSAQDELILSQGLSLGEVELCNLFLKLGLETRTNLEDSNSTGPFPEFKEQCLAGYFREEAMDCCIEWQDALKTSVLGHLKATGVYSLGGEAPIIVNLLTTLIVLLSIFEKMRPKEIQFQEIFTCYSSIDVIEATANDLATILLKEEWHELKNNFIRALGYAVWANNRCPLAYDRLGLGRNWEIVALSYTI